MSAISIDEEKRVIIIISDDSYIDCFKYSIKFEELIGYRFDYSRDGRINYEIKYEFLTKYGVIKAKYNERYTSSLTKEKRRNELLNKILDERIESQFA